MVSESNSDERPTGRTGEQADRFALVDVLRDGLEDLLGRDVGEGERTAIAALALNAATGAERVVALAVRSAIAVVRRSVSNRQSRTYARTKPLTYAEQVVSEQSTPVADWPLQIQMPLLLWCGARACGI